MYRGRRPTGNTREALHQQNIYDRVVGPAGGFNQSSTVSVSRTTQGVFLKARRAKKPGAAESSEITVKQYVIKSVLNDYLVCREWSNNSALFPPTETEGDTDVLVAKKHQQRLSVTSEVIDGVTFTYTYSDSNNRSSFDGTNSQLEVCFPRFKVGDKLFACKSENNTGVYVDTNPSGSPSLPDNVRTFIEWFDMTDRVWARRYIQ